MMTNPEHIAFIEPLPASPWPLWSDWFRLAKSHEMNDAEAMCLATVDSRGRPASRMVLLKGWDESGFAFYSNLDSRKGQHLAAKSEVALCFHWKSLLRQVRVEGLAERLSDEEADAYFASRSRRSQLGAWASQQSRPLKDRAALEARVNDVEHRYPSGDIPRPPYWHGWRVRPSLIEFWQQRDFRLHDRIEYSRAAEGGSWQITRLYP